MQIKIKNFGLLILLYAVFSCTDDLTEFNINSELSEDIDVNVSEVIQNISYSSTIDASQDRDIVSNIDKIISYEIEEVYFSISEFDGPETANMSGTISVGSGVNTYSVDIQSLNIKLFADDNYSISLSEEQLSALEGLLLSANQLEISFNGSVSEAPVSFKLTLTVKTMVKVDAS